MGLVLGNTLGRVRETGLGRSGKNVVQLQQGPQLTHREFWSWDGLSELSLSGTKSLCLSTQHQPALGRGLPQRRGPTFGNSFELRPVPGKGLADRPQQQALPEAGG